MHRFQLFFQTKINCLQISFQTVPIYLFIACRCGHGYFTEFLPVREFNT